MTYIPLRMSAERRRAKRAHKAGRQPTNVSGQPKPKRQKKQNKRDSQATLDVFRVPLVNSASVPANNNNNNNNNNGAASSASSNTDATHFQSTLTHADGEPLWRGREFTPSHRLPTLSQAEMQARIVLNRSLALQQSPPPPPAALPGSVCDYEEETLRAQQRAEWEASHSRHASVHLPSPAPQQHSTQLSSSLPAPSAT